MNRFLCFFLIKALILIECGSITFINCFSRSPFRLKDPFLPQLDVKYVGDNEIYSIKDSHLETYPTFAFSKKDFNEHVLPHGDIPPANEHDTTITGDHLRSLIRNLICEVRVRKKEFTDFTILQYKNFNRKRRSGLLVLKAKNYPYVIKLFMETPKSFTNPYRKGIEPMVFFYMAGGANRHLSGITRIKNREYLEHELNCLPQWKDLIYMPRKWLWVPENEPWLDLTGYNIGNQSETHTQLPSVYVIVADAINTNDSIYLPSRKRKSIIMKLCNDVDLFLDPHTNNYVFHKAATRTGYRIAVVDTEHFPTIAGFKQKVYCKTHLAWYGTLMGKCLHDMFFRSKRERREAQQKPHLLAERLMCS